jgi:HSP20 family molecular chaperone IbpA
VFRGAAFEAFFDVAHVELIMTALRDALRDLPDTVFADLLESEDKYLVVIDLPGVSAATVDVSVSNNRLRIEARREKSLPSEFKYVTENRSLFLDAELPLPPDATGEGAEAIMRKGVLELHLPTSSGDTGTHVEVTDA